ncbi:alpha/beta fold hydrolase [Chromatium okenii]|uniref:alpha/beta fold hydrolase n=1 Tax=Chromatium okenii TaxID=61644 RepID=UPI001F5B1A95|nr:alpha/beta fold hydrolase [Chromatium okenii]
MLHGFTGDHTDWQPIVGNHPAYCAIDLPGHGLSISSSSPRWQLPDAVFYSAWIAAQKASKKSAESAILNAQFAGIEHLIGYSFGGRMALVLLMAAPTQFRSITIIAAHPGLTTAAQRDQRRVADRAWITLLREQGIEAFVTAWEQQPLFATQRQLAPAVVAQQRARRLRQRAEGLARCLEQFGLAAMPSTWEALARFPGRVRWIVGGADQKFVALAQQVKTLRPATEVTVIAGGGHNLLLEHPDRVRELLGAGDAQKEF